MLVLSYKIPISAHNNYYISNADVDVMVMHIQRSYVIALSQCNAIQRKSTQTNRHTDVYT